MERYEYFNKLIEANAVYQKFIYKDREDDLGLAAANLSLLSALYEVRYGAVVNPKLIEDLIDPSNAPMNRLRRFKPIAETLNASQKAAISKALSMENLLVIEGPPGTGKTSVIVEFIQQVKRRDPALRILVTSQSGIAVDNALKGFVEKGLYLDQIARIKQKADSTLKEYSEISIFRQIVDSSEDRLKKILHSYDKEEKVDAAGRPCLNDFLNQNLSLVISQKSIVGVTSNSIPFCRFDIDHPFDYVIIDEVGKFSFAELMNVAKVAKKLLIIGDPQQLPAVISNDLSSMDGLLESECKQFFDAVAFIRENNFIDQVFSLVNKNCGTMLNVQYRMSDPIGSFISDTFYGGRVSNGIKRYNEDALNYVTYNDDECVRDTENYESEGEGSPRENKTEVVITKELLDKILESDSGRGDGSKIKDVLSEEVREDIEFSKYVAIITPYKMQKELMIKMIKAKYPDIQRVLVPNIGTVDSFQGKEFEYVIFSCARKSMSPFINDKRRINVAVSRARKQFYLIASRGLVKSANWINAITRYKKTFQYLTDEGIEKKYYECKHYIYRQGDGIRLIKKKREGFYPKSYNRNFRGKWNK